MLANSENFVVDEFPLRNTVVAQLVSSDIPEVADLHAGNSKPNIISAVDVSSFVVDGHYSFFRIRNSEASVLRSQRYLVGHILVLGGVKPQNRVSVVLSANY